MLSLPENIKKHFRHPLRRMSALLVCILGIWSCEPAPARSEASQLYESLPRDVIAYGGSDDLQAWLLRVQRYAQGAQPSVPPFALMAPNLVASGLGLTLPQLLDLSSPIRWLIASPKESEPLVKTTEPIKHSPYLTIPGREVRTPWRGVMAVKLSEGVQVEGLRDALNSSMWSVDGAREGGEALHAVMSAPADTLDEGHMILREGWLFIGNDLALIRRAIPALRKELARPLSDELSLNARLEPLERYLNRAHPERMAELKAKHERLWLTSQATLATLELKVTEGAVSLVFSARHKGRSPLQRHVIDGSEALSRLPKSVGGFVITSSSLPAWSSLVREYQAELPQLLTLLRPPPKLGLTFALNEQLELSALVTGGGVERGPWLSAFLKALTDGLNIKKAQDEAKRAISSGPKGAQDAVLVKDKPLGGQPVEALKLFGLPQPELDDPTPSLSQLNVQLSEARLLHARDASYFTFGPKSRAYLELWSQLAHAGQLGVEERADLRRFKGELSDLLLMLYLAPPSIDRALGALPEGRPQDPQGREGISFIARATEREMSLALTIPVGVTERVVRSALTGKLNISKSARP